jgi:predicted double-glycine peptidase
MSRARASIVAGAIALLGGGALAACAARPTELALPDVRQSTGWTCSAAALQAVLAYYGIEEREDRLARALGATPENGAPPEAIVRVARAHGLRAELREGMTVAELARAVAAGAPVLLAIQAWPERRTRSWRELWDDGHYVIVVAVESDRVVVEDPSLLGSRGVLGRAELEERWHDTDGKRRYLRLGILFGGRRPAPPPARRPVE